MNTPACFRKLKRYKYQLVEPFTYHTSFTGYTISVPFIRLATDGTLTIDPYYAWDGASGPTKDYKSSMRASLVHDALYQLFRMEKLPQNLVIPADKLFREMLIEDGMNPTKAELWYSGLRLANGLAAKPGTQKEVKVDCCP